MSDTLRGAARMTGDSNHIDVLEALVGDTVREVFEDDEHCIVLVMESDAAFVVTSLGVQTMPAFWIEDKESWNRRKRNVVRQLLETQRRLASLLGRPA